MNDTSKVFLITFFGSFMFGFLDNFLLVIFGESIDRTIAESFGLSTMFSAGLGNTFSDAIGAAGETFIAGAIIWAFGEACTKSVPKWMVMLASISGIISGCLVGLFPLAFI